MAFRLRCAPGACFIFAALLQSPTGAAQPVATAPLTLERAVAAALLGNPELRSFEFQIQAQDARTRQAGLRPATELSLDLENALGSGEYRGAESVEATLALSQVIELGGKRYGHTIDPRTGRPAMSDLLSASVIADDCATADALGTALMVMGTEGAKQWLTAHREVEGYLISDDGQGGYAVWMTPGWE